MHHHACTRTRTHTHIDTEAEEADLCIRVWRFHVLSGLVPQHLDVQQLGMVQTPLFRGLLGALIV